MPRTTCFIRLVFGDLKANNFKKKYQIYMYILFIGFDLLEVGQDEVTLRTGKQANRRNIQFVHQALLALFGNLNIFFFILLFKLIFLNIQILI